ncbi:MAG: NAD(P)H-hydrate dehydratase [Pseudonocardiaceae bacterium]|nr:NAD(P)H-hydrate dehydratase [Pseudonocardiaceae bacterium]
MRGAWTSERVRQAEEPVLAAAPEGALMRRAAFGVAVHATELLAEHTGAVAGRRVALLVGAGNNGGDALWAGAFLRRRGVAVQAVLLAPGKTHAAGLAALRRAGGRTVESDDDADTALAGADLVIDGIVGLAARGSLRPDAAALADRITAPILAVDMPSGVDTDTGVTDGPHIRAERTVTFGARKPVHVLNPTACGSVHLIELGLELTDPDIHTLDAVDVGLAWPIPGPADDKYTQGVTGVAAGSSTYPGAAVLTTGAAVLATAGMVRYAGPAADPVRARWPEVVATGSVADAGRVQAWVTGPGIGTGYEGRHTFEQVLGDGVPVCVDADGINLLAQAPELLDARDPATPVVLTPHDREFARLAGEAGPDRVAAARRAAAETNTVVLLKGNTTIVAAPDGRVLANAARGSWLATAGSGDVLSGLVGALLASGLDPWLAAGCAAWLHSLAGELAASGAPTSASGVLAAIPAAVRRARQSVSG